MFTKQGLPKSWVTLNDLEVTYHSLYNHNTKCSSHECKQLFPNVTFPALSH